MWRRRGQREGRAQGQEPERFARALTLGTSENLNEGKGNLRINDRSMRSQSGPFFGQVLSIV